MPRHDDTAFKAAYRKLNSAQKDAVDTIEGPVMVIAGPGTGKTQILTLRIANILRETDTPPDAILALTFTESGVRAMRERLASLVGPAAYRVTIATFHGYANSVIGRHPESFARIIGGSPMDEADELLLVREAVRTAGGDVLQPAGNPEFYLSAVRNAIADLKNDAVSPEEYQRFLDTADAEDKSYERSVALRAVYEAYERLLRSRQLFDYADMLVELVRALREDESLRLALAESAQYILADEHQDANLAQNHILELLASPLSGVPDDQPNLFVVGDEKQAVFRFQGASLENFLYFKRRYPSAKVITLIENYRSVQGILDASHGMIGEAVADIPRPQLRAQKVGEGAPISVVEAATPEAEIRFVVGEITKLLEAGTPPEAIAVIARRNQDAAAVASALRQEGIGCASAASGDALRDPLVTELVMLLRAIVDPHSEALARALLVPGFKVSPSELALVTRDAEKSGVPLFRVLKDPARLAALGVADSSRFTDAYALIEDLARRAARDDARIVFDEAVAETGFLEDVPAAPEMARALEAYHALRDVLARRAARDESYRLRDFCGLLEDIARGAVRISMPDAVPHGISVLTAHKAKGLEFAHVFVIRLTDREWLPRRERRFFLAPLAARESGDVEDERRLLYVALTRAKESATLSWPRAGEDGREEQSSRFLAELDERLVVRTAAPEDTAQAMPRRRAARIQAEARAELAALRARFLEHGISATALNTYRADPWAFFFRHLLRLPERKAPAQLYGSAVHAAMCEFFGALARGKKPTKRTLVALFKKALAAEPFSKADRARYEARGIAALEGYFDAYPYEFHDGNVRAELALRAVLPLPAGAPAASIPLSGFLDRVEYFADGSARIVDYKTGTPKSRGYIEGTTKDSDGNYKRQLVFYRLLLDLQAPPVPLREAVLDFVEPNPRGKYKRESFVPTDGEVTDVTEDIVHMVDDVAAFRFLEHESRSDDAEIRALAENVRRRYLGT